MVTFFRTPTSDVANSKADWRAKSNELSLFTFGFHILNDIKPKTMKLGGYIFSLKPAK